jgi:hypothetical protein
MKIERFLPLPLSQRHPGPDEPHWKIPHVEWPNVLHRVEHGSTLREIAHDYGVSYEAVRRVIQAARAENEEGNH